MKPVISIGLSHRQGVVGPVGSGRLGKRAAGWQIACTKSSDWPISTAQVVKLLLEQFDGSTWVHEFSTDYIGAPWQKSKGDKTSVDSTCATVWFDRFHTALEVRLTLEILTPCTFGAEVYVL